MKILLLLSVRSVITDLKVTKSYHLFGKGILKLRRKRINKKITEKKGREKRMRQDDT